MSTLQLDSLLVGIHDQNLRFSLAFGIGLHHAGLQDGDRKAVEECFVNQKIQVGGASLARQYAQLVI